MPGHVKRGGTGEPDPDPSPFLFVSWEDKQNDMAKVKSYILYRSTIPVLRYCYDKKLKQTYSR